MNEWVIRNAAGEESDFGVSVHDFDPYSGRSWRVTLLTPDGKTREMRASDLPGFVSRGGGFDPVQTYKTKEQADRALLRAERFAKRKEKGK